MALWARNEAAACEAAAGLFLHVAGQRSRCRAYSAGVGIDSPFGATGAGAKAGSKTWITLMRAGLLAALAIFFNKPLATVAFLSGLDKSRCKGVWRLQK